MVQIGFPGNTEALVLRLKPCNCLHTHLPARPGALIKINEFTQDSELYISMFDKRECKRLQHLQFNNTLLVQTNMTNKRKQAWSLEWVSSNTNLPQTLLYMPLLSSSYWPSLEKREVNFPLLSFINKIYKLYRKEQQNQSGWRNWLMRKKIHRAWWSGGSQAMW